MDYIIENIFPTPIYVAGVDNLEELQTELDSAFPNIQFDEPGFDTWGKTHKISSSQFKDDLIKTHNLQVFKQTIDKHIRTYCQELGFAYRDYDTRSWMTAFSKGEYAHIHTHPRVDMSGVYYYKTNEKDGNFFFESPIECGKDSLCYGNFNSRWTHRPVVGKIMLFPYYINHGVTTNTTDSVRHSIAFNIKFK